MARRRKGRKTGSDSSDEFQAFPTAKTTGYSQIENHGRERLLGFLCFAEQSDCFGAVT